VRVFVAGATGYVGAAVVSELVAAGHLVTGLSRSPAKAAEVAALGARPHAGDLDDPASYAGVAGDHDALVHVASITGPDRAARDRAAIFAMIDAARATSAPRMVVYTSGVWTLGSTGDTPATEDAPTDHPARLSVHRVALERDVIAAAGGALATAVLRPGDVYGGREGVASWLAQWLPESAGRAGIVHLGDGRNRWPLVHRLDLGRFYRLVLERRAGGILHAVEDVAVPVVELARALGRVAGLQVSSWSPAEAELKLGPGYVEALLLDQVIAAPRARALLGWRPERPPFLEAVAEVWADRLAG
jgi:nucleoside-diphosphate-sugar epimerase